MDALEQERARQRTVNAYHRVFTTADGKEVLEDLRRYFKTDQPSFIFGQSYVDAAVRDGQRQVIIRINDQLRKTIMADGDVEKPQAKIKK
jgi:hypothetical protein